MPEIKIVIIEHDPNDIDLIRHELDVSGIDYVAQIVQNEKDYMDALEHFMPNIILSDYSLPIFNGYDAFKIKEKVTPNTPFIFVSGTIGEENAIELISKGVTDYALKDKLFTLPQKIIRALKSADEKREKEKNEQQKEFDTSNLNALINNTKDLMWSVDRDFKLISSNKPYDVVVQNYMGNIIAKGSSVLPAGLPAEILVRYKAFYERAFAGETFTEVDHYTIPVDYWMEISFYPIRKGSEVVGTACHSRDITERKKSEIQVREFAKQLNNTLEEERARLAREIHDELGQQLVGIKIGLSLLVKQRDKADIKIKEMMEVVNETIHSLRKISTELRPSILNTLGLFPSIKWLAAEFERKNKIKCNAQVTGNDQEFAENISICFFRICQESLTNISKHAEATEVDISIAQSEGELKLKIADNGKGISSSKLENPFSMGLLGMRERANIIGGTLIVTSEINKGTTILLKSKCTN